MHHNPACFSSYMGLWAMRLDSLRSGLAAVRAGTLRAQFGEDPPKPQPPYGVSGNVAVIDIMGATMKGDSKFGGTSTVRVRKALRAALADDAVEAILLRIDSPGGHVAGTMELSDDVAAAAARKPVHVFGEDTLASAAYWTASRANRITANEVAVVGSIGVYGVLYDESKAAEMAGVTVHVVSSGPLKGAGEPGTAVTPEVLAEMQSYVDAISAKFFGSVRTGRGLSPKQLAEATTGGSWVAETAASIGLLDGVGTLEEALKAASEDGKGRKRRMAAADRARRM